MSINMHWYKYTQYSHYLDEFYFRCEYYSLSNWMILLRTCRLYPDQVQRNIFDRKWQSSEPEVEIMLSKEHQILWHVILTGRGVKDFKKGRFRLLVPTIITSGFRKMPYFLTMDPGGGQSFWIKDVLVSDSHPQLIEPCLEHVKLDRTF